MLHDPSRRRVAPRSHRHARRDDSFELRLPVERAGWDAQRRVELMEMPAQPLLCSAAFVDEIVAMHNQQLQLAQTPLARPRPIQGSRKAARAAASASIASDLPRW